MSKGRAGSRKNRVYVFREWLLRTYGSYLSEEMVKRGDEYNLGDNSYPTTDSSTRKRRRNPNKDNTGVILDVAGGKGDLSWLLKNVDGLESIVLDPWQADPNTMSRNERMVRSIEYLRTHPEEVKQRSLPFLPSYQPLAGLLPKLLQERTKRLCKDHPTQHHDNNRKLKDPFERDCNVPCRPNDFLTPRILHVALDESMVQKVQNRIMGAGSDKNRNTIIEQNKAFNANDNPSEVKSTTHEDQVVDLLSSGRIKLILGFHPDQATEPIIDLANVLNIPYCVVPCCVFPSEFPSRMVRVEASEPRDEPNGSDKTDQNPDTEKLVPVRTYHQFLEYLQQKAASFSILKTLEKGTSGNENNSCTTINTGYLNFPFTETAKNIVLYTLPPKQLSCNRST